MSDNKHSLESLAPIARGETFPAFDPRGVSPAQLQQILEQGIAAHQNGDKERAEKCYRRVLDAAPNQPDALNLLGVLAAEAGLYGMAVDLMDRALMTRPKDPHILNNKGHALSEMRRWDEARDFLERAIALKPDFDEAKYNLGRVLRQLGHVDKALLLWRDVWKSDDRVFAALVGITGVLTDQGKFEEAERTAREVIAHLPHRPAGYIGLAHTHKFTKDDGTLEQIEAQLKKDDVPTEDRVALHYAAGKISDDLKSYENAFNHFDKANSIAFQSYDHKRTEAYRRQKKTVFSKRFFKERPDWGYKSSLPIFIVGMPRSGTTLTEQILSAHPDVYGAGEIESFDKLARLAEKITPSRDEFPTNMLKLSKFGAELIGERYIEDLRHRADRAVSRISNKMPHNFELLGLIAITLPGAKIIHCRRSPLDTCLSCWTKNFNDAHGYNRSLTDVGRYYRGYHDLMQHWREVLPLEILDIDYESYTTDLEGTARKLIDFTGLEWNPRVLDFYSINRPVRTASQWQVRQPIYKTSVEKWRNYMPWLQPLVDALGPLAQGLE
ncbi:MAG: sulfotransferase [Proteobacteria bacterium]|nr:sulfotransferase [Pseudomonadota bacterium]